MKNNNIHNDKSQLADKRLAEMLHAIEHAGRDKRRQQQLSILIDQMAAEEAVVASQRNRKRWTLAISAAACIVLFVTTLVRLTSTTATVLPAGYTSMASVVNDTLIENTENSDSLPTIPQHTVRKRETLMIAYNKVSNDESSQDAEETPSIEDTIIDIIEPEVFMAEDINGNDEKNESVDIIAAPVTCVGNNDNVTVREKQEPTKNQHLLIRIRRSKPSKMDGTMLALRIM